MHYTYPFLMHRRHVVDSFVCQQYSYVAISVYDNDSTEHYVFLGLTERTPIELCCFGALMHVTMLSAIYMTLVIQAPHFFL